MEMLKKFFLALVLLLIVAVIWAGTTIYFKKSNVEVNSNASTYTRQIRGAFDTDELDIVTQKTESSFSVSPSEFLNLTEDSN